MTETMEAPALAAWRGRHQGATIVVCGCGRSLNDLPDPGRWLTIGVNDVGRLFDPTYLVVVNPRSQFAPDRFRHVAQSRARALFTQLDDRQLGVDHPPLVRFRLGRRAGTDLADLETLPYTRNSPYVAVCLAAFMGATRIGLIGVDFTDHHFFGQTGRHALARELAVIDREYAALAHAFRRRGIELVNLSRQSRLSALPRAEACAFVEGSRPPSRVAVPAPVAAPRPAPAPAPRVFFVHYQFLSCGDVFTVGLEHAAGELGLTWASAGCDDADLARKVARFSPDLLFVVHGRRFRQRWADRVRAPMRAVWLLDEPYEVDDTVLTSRAFDRVFVNDPSTLDRHRHAHYLPVAWDARRHTAPPGGERRYAVGFIGGGNPTREALLVELAREGLLSYVVGGPWKSARLRALSLGSTVPPSRTAELYQSTQIVVNVFRDRHHFNREQLPATSLNPRVYEALACGALVVSEERLEAHTLFPDMPCFRDAGGLVAHVRQLLAEPERRRALLGACRARLAGHTYTDRLRTALAVALPGLDRADALPDHQRSLVMPQAVATPDCAYSILMAVHNGLELTRLAVRRTLRHTAGSDARLVVVDNASTDGVSEWLRLLARRGDLTLVEPGSNLGHGPALELARTRTRSPYLVTLDSDAFPLADDWLAQLRARLDAGASVTGILHHRNYIHPSCLMIARRTLDDLGVTFLDEKDRPSRLDVAERISVEVLRRGGRLAGLQRSGARRRGSRAEPVYLGSTYEGVVYHQWYSTRAALSPGRPVDDVPRADLDRTLEEVLDDGHRDPRDATIVVGVRLAPGDEARLRNARAALTALNFQDLDRHRFHVVLVEQGTAPHAIRALAPLVDRTLFIYNPGPYNRGWAFNVGAVLAGPNAGPLCLLDADLLVPPDFVRRGIAALEGGARAVLPYRHVRYLSAVDTPRAIAERLAAPGARPDPGRFGGRVFTDSQGGAIWVEASTYGAIGGHDERFRGWGCEDREICRRLGRAGAGPSRLSGCLLHLDHPRPLETDPTALANQALYARLEREAHDESAAGRAIGDPHLYAGEAPERRERRATAGARDWERWNQWDAGRIDQILKDEQALGPVESARRKVADLMGRLGRRVLDLGCGPGALWPHFARHQHEVDWVGVDVTRAMLAAARRSFPGARLVQADGGHLPFRDGAFEAVVLRHVLEHVPHWLLVRLLAEARRVATRAVVVVFFVPPGGSRYTTTVGEGFLETCWDQRDVEQPMVASGWQLCERRPVGGGDEAWVLAPGGLGADLFLYPEPPPPRDEPFKFSIIMPTYRRSHRLATTVGTVLAQTYSNWELIIIDNAGDCDLRVADPRVSIRVHTEKASAAFARNQGLRYATGDLVCFFDDDDDMFPSYLASFAATFRANPEAKMVRCGMVIPGGRVNYSYATPEVCVRREYVTPTWQRCGPLQDQTYFRGLVASRRWREHRKDIVVVRAPLCRANSDPRGGLRAGGY